MSVIQPDPIRSPVDALKSFEGETKLRRDVERTFSRPNYVPEEFWANAIDKIGLDLFLPSSQIQGLSGAAPQQARVLDSHPTSSTTYVSLAGGPSFASLPAGAYILTYGSNYDNGTGGDGFASPSINGAVASDDDAAYAQASVSETRFNIFQALTAQLTEDSNTVELKFRVSSGTGSFFRRWLIVQRTGNL